MKSSTLQFITCICVSLFSFISSQSHAQKPEKIYSFVKVVKPISWYEEQAALWKAEIDKNKKNADAWLNYYRASRNRNLMEEADTTIINHKYDLLKKIEKEMAKAIPNTFEYHLVAWANAGNNGTKKSDLEMAKKLGPDRLELLPDLVNEAELKLDTEKRHEVCRRWYLTGDHSSGILNYNYNVLVSLPANTILLTCGDNDTYPIWILQGGMGIRKDVTVLNISFLYMNEYRESMFRKLGIEQMEDPLAPAKSAEEFTKKYEYFEQNLIKHMAANKNKYPVCVPSTMDPQYNVLIEDKLYNIGLALQYSEERLDNLPIIKRNVEKLYKLDYLEVDFSADISEGIVNRMNCNYVAPFSKLYDFYKASGEQDHAERIKTLMMIVAQQSGKEKEVEELLNSTKH